MSQSAPAEPIVTVPDQPPTPLGELAAAIRQYVSAERLGENKRRRRDLSRLVFELCWACRPKWHEHEMRCTDGTTASVVWTYSSISVQCNTPEGGQVGCLLKPRRSTDPPSRLDQDLDDIQIEVTRARHETAFGKRMPDENGRPLPVPATDRLLAIADRIEAQQGSDRSTAASDVQVKPSAVTDEAVSIEAKVSVENGVLNETSVDSHGDEDYVLQSEDVLILEVLERAGQALTQVEIETYETQMPSRSTIGRRLERLRSAGYIRRPHGGRGGDAITDNGKAALKKTSHPTEH